MLIQKVALSRPISIYPPGHTRPMRKPCKFQIDNFVVGESSLIVYHSPAFCLQPIRSASLCCEGQPSLSEQKNATGKYSQWKSISKKNVHSTKEKEHIYTTSASIPNCLN